MGAAPPRAGYPLRCADGERYARPRAAAAGNGAAMRIAIAVGRIAVALAIVAAVVGQLVHSISWAATLDPPIDAGGLVANFFAFFTIESNLIAAVALVIAAGLLLRGRQERGWVAVLRAGAATYMTTTGIVYNLLLRGIELPQGQTLAWSNEVLHLIAPTLVLLDWLLGAGRRPVRWAAIWPIIAFPLAWTLFTMLRGPLVGWYPYPFLNPANGGAGSVAFWIVVVAAVIIGLSAAMILISRRLPPLARQ